MEKTVALISIIVKNDDRVDELNSVLHDYRDYIVGRMGLPYKERKINIISIAIDAPKATVDELSGRVSALSGITSDTIYAL